MQKFLLAACSALALGACSKETDKTSAEPTAAPETAMEAPAPTASEQLDAVLAGEQRSNEERARDEFRNPKQTLEFFDIEPTMTVVEIWPGGGWYTNVIAPYLAGGDGTYYAAQFSPSRGERYAAAIERFKEKYADTSVYGNVTVTELSEEGEIAPAGTADAVLTFRNVHNWTGSGAAEGYFKKFYDALKPGGVLGVVEHRADTVEGEGDSGYVTEATVIALAEGAGFSLADKSEINANAKDTKDHPYGVWTLPPVRRSSEVRGEEDPDFDRAKYDAIGESDRMTLKFVKPAGE